MDKSSKSIDTNPIKAPYKPGEYVETNIGCVPVEDLRDILAYQSGFEDYADMRKHGLKFGNNLDPDFNLEDELVAIGGTDEFGIKVEDPIKLGM